MSAGMRLCSLRWCLFLEPDCEVQSVILTGSASKFHGSAHQIDQPARDHQAEARRIGPQGRTHIRVAERLADQRLLSRRNPNARIGYRHANENVIRGIRLQGG